MSEEQIPVVSKLTRDLIAAGRLLEPREARFLVDDYYMMQKGRVRASHQTRCLVKTGEPYELLAWSAEQSRIVEDEIRKALAKYAESKRPGRWMLSQYGIGPVIAAGLLAHIELEPWHCTRAKDRCSKEEPHGPECHTVHVDTAGKVWRFAGLDPTVTWDKGEKRPWNASLKRLCWIVGESFKKFSNAEECVYGKIYRERKALEIERNERGDFRDQAKASLESKRFRNDTATKVAYEQGKLPPGRLDLRAMRYATKLFLSHVHAVMYEDRYGEAPSKPYIFTRPEHTHYVAPPGWPCE